MRKIILFFFFTLLLFVQVVKAQFSKPIPASAAFTESLSRVTDDFRNNYYRIQGAQLASQPDMETYRSTVSLPGAKNCVIYRFHSTVDTTASWQGIMYEGDNYKEALKIYKNTCGQVERSRLNLNGMPSTKFTGKMEAPDGNLSFANSSFKLKTDNEIYGSFHAEVELINTTFDQWEVHLNLHNTKDDSDQ